MPIHDWSRAEPGSFPDFHTTWAVEIKRALNRTLLPAGYFAVIERGAVGYVPDVLTLEGVASAPGDPGGGTLTAPRLRPAARIDWPDRKPKPKHVEVRDAENRRLVAVIEIVSPANKESRHGLRSFVRKARAILESRIHLMVLDVWPPMMDRHGLHAAIWHDFRGKPYAPPEGRPLTFASYEAVPGGAVAYVVPSAVGEAAPELPLFLRPGQCVEVPLAPTYDAAFADVPAPVRRPLEG